MSYSIRRRLTPDQRDTREDREQALYDRLAGQIEEEQRAEYETEFGAGYRAKHPFKPHGIHDQVTERMRAALA